MPPAAHLPSNFTFPKGLHTTIHLSNDMKVRDHKPAIPEELIILLRGFKLENLKK